MNKLYIPVLAGTTRPLRESIHAARLVAEVGKTIDEIETELVDPMDFNLPYDGNDDEYRDPRFSDIISRADGLFIVTPEYNHSIPGSLKRMIDSELDNYIHKAVAFAGVSSGPWGGVRAIEALNTIVREGGLVATFTDVQFPFVQKLFDQQGKLLEEKYRERIMRSWIELIWMAKTLKYGREHIPSRYHKK